VPQCIQELFNDSNLQVVLDNLYVISTAAVVASTSLTLWSCETSCQEYEWFEMVHSVAVFKMGALVHADPARLLHGGCETVRD
jgi:hypothetical protein